MTNTNKILLETLLNIEFELGKTNLLIEKYNINFTITSNFDSSFDIFTTIVKAFKIPKKYYNNLYNILYDLFLNKISPKTCIKKIEKLIT